VLWKTTRLLPPDRYRCSIATFATRASEVVAASFDCPVHLFPIRRTYDWQAIKTAVRLARFIRSERISIVHTFFPVSDLYGGLVARLSGCPVVISSRRDMGFQRTAAQRAAYRLGRALYRQVHAVCEQVRLKHIEEDGLDPGRVVTVHNGVDLEAIDAEAPASHAGLGIDETTCIIACVANIRPVKGLEVLVRAAERVCRAMPRARFLVIGAVNHEPYFRSLQELAETLGVSGKITFAGPSRHVPALLKACRLFFLPSRSEGMSNALLEAMACGLPCVASDVGGNKDLIENGRNGYLVPSGDETAAAERILGLLGDDGLAARIGQAGRRMVEDRFTAAAMVNRLMALYDGLLASAGKRGQLPAPGGEAMAS